MGQEINTRVVIAWHLSFSMDMRNPQAAQNTECLHLCFAAHTLGSIDKGANESEKVQIFLLPLYRYCSYKKGPKASVFIS